MWKVVFCFVLLAQAVMAQESELSDTAKKYAERLVENKRRAIQKAEEQIAKLRKSKASKQEFAQAKQLLDKLKNENSFELPSFRFDLMQPDYVGEFITQERLGDRTYISEPSRFQVIEILSDTSVIASLKQTTVILKGISTKNLTTETPKHFPGPFICKGTETYETAGAGTATVWVFEKFAEHDEAVAYAQKLMKKKK